MTAAEKINVYLDRAERYMRTPWEQRDPDELKALMALKAEIYSENQMEMK